MGFAVAKLPHLMGRIKKRPDLSSRSFEFSTIKSILGPEMGGALVIDEEVYKYNVAANCVEFMQN